jgi:hypothetical protein
VRSQQQHQLLQWPIKCTCILDGTTGLVVIRGFTFQFIIDAEAACVVCISRHTQHEVCISLRCVRDGFCAYGDAR